MTTNEKALLLHEEWKGKLETVSKAKVASREDLALVYYYLILYQHLLTYRRYNFHQ